MKKIACVVILALTVLFNYENGHDKHMDLQSGAYVALTFDDGPDPRYTPEILDILRVHQAKATFFLIGSQVRKWPKITQSILSDGHEIGNHSYNHVHWKSNYKYVLTDMLRTDRIIKQSTGSTVKYYRPPKGLISLANLKAAYSLNHRVVLWDVCLERANETPASMVERTCRYIHDGAIILAHDGRLNRDKSLVALPLLLSNLEAKGYKVVSLSLLAQVSSNQPNLDIQKLASLELSNLANLDNYKHRSKDGSWQE